MPNDAPPRLSQTEALDLLRPGRAAAERLVDRLNAEAGMRHWSDDARTAFREAAAWACDLFAIDRRVPSGLVEPACPTCGNTVEPLPRGGGYLERNHLGHLRADTLAGMCRCAACRRIYSRVALRYRAPQVEGRAEVPPVPPVNTPQRAQEAPSAPPAAPPAAAPPAPAPAPLGPAQDDDEQVTVRAQLPLAALPGLIELLRVGPDSAGGPVHLLARTRLAMALRFALVTVGRREPRRSRLLDVRGCSACAGDHAGLVAAGMRPTVDGCDWATVCPTTGEILYVCDEPRQAAVDAVAAAHADEFAAGLGCAPDEVRAAAPRVVDRRSPDYCPLCDGPHATGPDGRYTHTRGGEPLSDGNQR